MRNTYTYVVATFSDFYLHSKELQTAKHGFSDIDMLQGVEIKGKFVVCYTSFATFIGVFRPIKVANFS